MAQVIEKGIFLTFDEIKILLFNMGVSEIEGVYMPEKSFSKEEIILAMHHMSDVGVIEATEEKFRIREDVKMLLTIMAYPQQTEIWCPYGEEGPNYFLYRKEGWVVSSEQFFRKKDTLKLTMFDNECFEKWREECRNDHCRD